MIYFPLLQLSGREMFTFNPAMAADSDAFEDGDDAFDTGNLPMDDDEQDTNEVRTYVVMSTGHLTLCLVNWIIY